MHIHKKETDVKSINNIFRANVNIKLNVHQGILNGNILDEGINIIICGENALIFSCKDNSQYIPVI